MTECYSNPIRFSSVKRSEVETDFSNDEITSYGGVQLLSKVGQWLGLTQSVVWVRVGCRRQFSCDLSLADLLRQRIYALALGYEDLNDHGELRYDPALQTVSGVWFPPAPRLPIHLLPP